MTTMVERVARAIEPETFRRQDIAIQFLKSAGREWEGSPEQETHRVKIAAARGRARAAIEALIDPTPIYSEQRTVNEYLYKALKEAR